jgi:predicted enzyme related to lactoylglutathione lyase
MDRMPDGKICYIEIPSRDIGVSAAFYTESFGWKVRTRGDGQRAFDDTTGQVSGAWVVNRPPSREPGMLPYIMVDDIDATVRKVTAAGGRLVTPKTPINPNDFFATFLDPAGNLLGLYQEAKR